jgi:hypothetical protein
VVRIKLLKSLLAMIENSAKGGNNYFFRNLWADEDGKEIDILENGQNSCCAHVTWILYLLNDTLEYAKKPHWIKFKHATVFSTEKDLLANGWFEIKDHRPGAVIIWEPRTASVHGLLGDKNAELQHIGFCVSETEAISNDSKKTGFPVRHHITYNETRPIKKILWHPELDND